MSGQTVQWSAPAMPPAETKLLHKVYDAADVILEYGSGGSTEYAAQLPNKLIFSVESDRDWAASLQRKLDAGNLPSSAIIYHVDIGETGAWGRPKDDRSWRNFHRYPISIWTAGFFRQPDAVLIDGRMRSACFIATCLQARKPVTVLFDDYASRPAYHVVEKLIKPVEMVGRMARFQLIPRVWPDWTTALLLEQCAVQTFTT